MTCLERSAVRAARLQGCTDADVAEMLTSLRAQDAAAHVAAASAPAMLDDDDFPRLTLAPRADDDAPLTMEPRPDPDTL